MDFEVSYWLADSLDTAHIYTLKDNIETCLAGQMYRDVRYNFNIEFCETFAFFNKTNSFRI